jgi:hypothetical protein
MAQELRRRQEKPFFRRVMPREFLFLDFAIALISFLLAGAVFALYVLMAAMQELVIPQLPTAWLLSTKLPSFNAIVLAL